MSHENSISSPNTIPLERHSPNFLPSQFMDLEINIVDVQIKFRPKFIDDVRSRKHYWNDSFSDGIADLLFSLYYTWVKTHAECMDESGVLDWTSAKLQGLPLRPEDYRADFFGRILPLYFLPCSVNRIERIQFWNGMTLVMISLNIKRFTFRSFGICIQND